VWTVTLAVVAPPGTVTVPGRLAIAELPLERVITAPAAGACPVSAIVAVDVPPPVTLAGARVSEAKTGALTVRVGVRVTPFNVAEIFTAVFAVTTCVVMVAVPVVEPAATVMLPETAATGGLLLVSVTSVPPAGAGPLSVAVATELAPPERLVGLSVNESNTAG